MTESDLVANVFICLCLCLLSVCYVCVYAPMFFKILKHDLHYDFRGLLDCL